MQGTKKYSVMAGFQQEYWRGSAVFRSRLMGVFAFLYMGDELAEADPGE